MTALDHDVVVVGGGPAGLSTALFLAALEPRLASRVAVLERARYPREKICAGAVGARADRALAAIGVRVDVPSVHVDAISVATRARALRAAEPTGEPRGRVVRRAEFDHALAEHARARGIAVVDGVKVTGVAPGPDAVALETSRGPLRARVVVGADGVGSFVRRALGLAEGALAAQVVEVDTPPLERERDPSDASGGSTLAFDLRDRSLTGYAWDFPTPLGGEVWRSRGIYQLRLESAREPFTDVSALLEARLARQGLGSTPRAAFRRFAERGLPLASPIAAPRVLLVGEAAGIDPALGEGIAQAILYGREAARYLAPALASGDLAFTTWRAHLAATRLGLDLAVRTRAASLLFSDRAISTRVLRPLVERWTTRSPSLARAGLRWFGGEPVPRAWLARALVDLFTSWS